MVNFLIPDLGPCQPVCGLHRQEELEDIPKTLLLDDGHNELVVVFFLVDEGVEEGEMLVDISTLVLELLEIPQVGINNIFDNIFFVSLSPIIKSIAEDVVLE